MAVAAVHTEGLIVAAVGAAAVDPTMIKVVEQVDLVFGVG